MVVIVIKKNTSQCLRLAPFSATSDSSTTSEFWMNSGDDIRGQAAIIPREAIPVDTRASDCPYLIQKRKMPGTGSPTMKERKRCTAGTSTRPYTGCRPILLERPWNSSKGGRFRTGNGRILLSNYVVLFEANRLWNKV
jgi:hypothetical protein